MTRALLLAAAVAATVGVHAAQPASAPQQLGRLFFTPTERAQLDVARIQRKPPPPPAAPEPGADPAPPPQVVTYGGIVRRSDGHSTLWLNNRPVDEKEALSGSSLRGRVRPDGAVTLQVPDRTGTIDIKVGQSVELQSGRIAEVRKPAPESKPAVDAKPPLEQKPEAEPTAVPEKKASTEASTPATAR